MEERSGRRWFLKSVPASALSADPHSDHGHSELVAQAGSAKGQFQPQAYGWLTQPEQAFIEAAVARLIPADELGPGAKEAESLISSTSSWREPTARWGAITSRAPGRRALPSRAISRV